MQRDSPRDILEKLIGFDTVSARSNRALIDWIADFLDPVADTTTLLPSPDGKKANLVARIGPDRPGGLVLSGHTDVVPVEGQTWSSDPFTLTERDGRLYGRGTADMKGFIALALSLADTYRARALDRPIYFAFSYDEEVGCLGAPQIAEALRELDTRPALAIIGEPTNLQPVNGHKGCDVFSLSVTGKPAHSSDPAKGANAIDYAIDFLIFARSLFDERNRRHGGDPTFDPPWSTMNIGRIAGGEAVNIVAGDCTVLWECRTLPADEIAEILDALEHHLETVLRPRLRAQAPSGRIELAHIASVPKLTPEPEGTAEALVKQITGLNMSRTVAFGSEAGLFQKAGLSAVVCGPGSIEQAHQPDEFITLEQFDAGRRFLDRVGASLVRN